MAQKKSLSINFYSLSIILLLVSPQAVSGVPVTSSTDTTTQSSCYGFLISFPSLNYTEERKYDQQELQNTIMNCINDVLRLHIPVYWSSTDLLLQSKEMNQSAVSQQKLFPKGTFIVPFTGNISLDTQLIVLIYDYNISSELSKYEKPQVPIDMILEPIYKLDGYELHEPRIAYNYGKGVTHADWYFESLTDAGCLTNVFLDDKETPRQLTTHDFNVFIWGGGSLNFNILNSFYTSSRILSLYRIKQFVVNGGGYIGSCYGAEAASSGLTLLPIFIPEHYLSRLPTIGCLALGDFLVSQAVPADINITIQESDSPVLFGVNGTITGSGLIGGPIVTWYGKNTESLATAKDVEPSNRELSYIFPRFYPFLNEKLIQRWANFTEGKTIWTVSQCKKGKIVTFCDHPEIGDPKELRVLYNAIFYVCSQPVSQKDFTREKQVSEIETIGIKSVNIPFEKPFSLNVSSSIYDHINTTLNSCKKIYNQFDDLENYIYLDLMENNHTLSDDFFYKMGDYGFWDARWTVQNCMNYLENQWHGWSRENATYNLYLLDAIMALLQSTHGSINESLDRLQTDILRKLIDTDKSLSKLVECLDKVDNEIHIYQNTTLQNNKILLLCIELNTYARQIYKQIPQIPFEILKLLRDSWYTYEGFFVQKQ